MNVLTRPWNWFYGCVRSPLAWALVGVHAVWFFAAIAAMGPLSRAAAQFWDSLQGADWTIFAGRTFHFYYEPKILKSLFFADLPALLAAGLGDLLTLPLARLAHLGTYEASYVAAGELLLAGTFQWLIIGRLIEARRHRSRIAKAPA
jgi:hypothetical protein